MVKLLDYCLACCVILMSPTETPYNMQNIKLLKKLFLLKFLVGKDALDNFKEEIIIHN
jgi:hypothetical protein